METKKISFGFSKTSKKTELITKVAKPEEKVQLIECLEGHSIKIKDEIKKSEGPLIIPIQGSSNRLLDEIKKVREKRIKEEVEDEKPDSELSIDELAARELIREAKNRDVIKTETKVFTLPLTEEKFEAEGAEESSLQDYEKVPISDYGMAMLRGMNWKEGMPIGKRAQKFEPPKVPELRPKGLGLGANKMIRSSEKQKDQDGKELKLVKGAFCKIIAGNHRGHYCEVQGLDDENCRVIVKTSLSNEVLSLNEFLISLVSKEEYVKNSKVINNVKYEEYKDKEERRDRDERKKKKKKNKHKSHSSDSEEERRSRHRKKNKSRHKNSSDTDEERRRSRR